MENVILVECDKFININKKSSPLKKQKEIFNRLLDQRVSELHCKITVIVR